MKINIPYRFQLVLPILGWATVCFVFGVITILNIAQFDILSQTIFLLISLFYFLFWVCFSMARVYPYKYFSTLEVKLMSRNIKNEKLAKNLDSSEVSKTFSALAEFSRRYFRNTILAGVCFVLILSIWQLVFFSNYFNILVIIFSGIVSVSLLAGFSIFWPQMYSFDIIKECRDFLSSKGLCPIEPNFYSIRLKFFFLIFFLIDALILYVLSKYAASFAVGSVLFVVGLTMIIFVSLILLFYLEKSFKEFFDLAKMVSREGLTIFSTGSLDKEFVNLAKSLNEISVQLYSSKQEAEDSKHEMGKRVDELEKFFDLTISREEKMIELKKENEELRQKIENLNKKQKKNV